MATTISGNLSGDVVTKINTNAKTARSINKIINGNFDIWQRGTSQTADGYGSDDRWINYRTGSTQVASRQPFPLGQTDVPNNPKYYARTVVSSVAGAGNYVIKAQNIEGVQNFQGTTATISFWAKADASKNIAVECIQYFGTGGSPSTQVSEIGVTTVALTASWAKHTISVAIPSINGKTLGTNDNDYLGVYLWMDAGSSYNARTNSLGQQSGTFEFSQIQMEAGSVATDFEQRSVGEELALCQRYFERNVQFGVVLILGYTCTGVPFAVTKRGVPSMTYYSGFNGAGTAGRLAEAEASGAAKVVGSSQFDKSGIRRITISSAGYTMTTMRGSFDASAEL